MEYVQKIEQFIQYTIEHSLDTDNLSIWSKHYFSSEDHKYMTKAEIRGMVGPTTRRLFFDDAVRNYDNFVEWYREPTALEYHRLLSSLEAHESRCITFFDNNFKNILGSAIIGISHYEIDKYNEKREKEIDQIIKKKKKGILTIQRNFRKYRYDPKFKFCKLVQVRNLLNIRYIDIQEFEKYLLDEGICFCSKK
jgi:hypothetical protein